MPYLAALVHLAAIESIIGLTTSLLLVANIGSSGVTYMTVTLPIVSPSLVAKLLT